MTAVVGILNKQGVALASDSAVTRTREVAKGNTVKITQNGNKMIRISDSCLICVMVTGNAEYMGVPWDIIVRHYRKYNGTTLHRTLEDAIHDFFKFIPNIKELQINDYPYLSHDSAELIFAGYSHEALYPSLVPVIVQGMKGHRVNYHYRENDMITISDSLPAAICPFAMTEVMDSLIWGASPLWISRISKSLDSMLEPGSDWMVNHITPDDLDARIAEISRTVGTSGIKKDFQRRLEAHSANQKAEMESRIIDYDLQSMADLAESLIQMTSLYNKLTFKQEHVGGETDLATISREHGFVWLNRKSWYHHKDPDGRHGMLGI